MKQLLIRLLNRLGLVPARRYRFVVGQLRESEAKTRKLSALLDEMRTESRAWKEKAGEALKQFRDLERTTSHREQQAEKVKLKDEKRVQAEMERGKRAAADLEDLQKQLVVAERGLVIAREQLMAVEVKLDILEGAANVLDSRTRPVIRQPGEPGVRV